MKKRPVEERFWEKVGFHDDPTKCWLWLGTASTGSHSKQKYGYLRVDDKMVLVHHISYEMYYHVTIPKGMTIDHVKARGCTNTLCVNPHHLEVVTNKVNILRGIAPSAVHAKATCCLHGHPFNEENTYVYPSGRRNCCVCHREQNRKYYAKKVKAQNG